MGARPSDFVPGFSRDVSDLRRLLSRSLSDAACLISSSMAGAARRVFNAFGRLILVALVGHLCSPSFLHDEFVNAHPSASNAVAIGPFLLSLIIFGDPRRCIAAPLRSIAAAAKP
jgi:hypothetical protein